MTRSVGGDPANIKQLAIRGGSLRVIALVSGCLWWLSACSSETPGPTGTGGTVGAGGATVGGASASGGASVGGSSGGAPPSGGALESGGVGPSGGLAESGGTDSAGGSGGLGGGPDGSGGGPLFALTSPAFKNVDGCSLEMPRLCEVFPDENVSYMDNANVSPELHWSGVPLGTQSFALVLFDVSFGQAHWALWNIPADTVMLAADVPKDTANPAVPAGSQQANANFAFEGDGYFGPHLPCNVFEFQLYALSMSTFSPQDPDSSVLVSIELADLGEPVLGVARLMARSADYDTTCE
jgi:Raf kinase inhibitor-like YbhB/YbcL family protein